MNVLISNSRVGGSLPISFVSRYQGLHLFIRQKIVENYDPRRSGNDIHSVVSEFNRDIRFISPGMYIGSVDMLREDLFKYGRNSHNN